MIHFLLSRSLEWWWAYVHSFKFEMPAFALNRWSAVRDEKAPLAEAFVGAQCKRPILDVGHAAKTFVGEYMNGECQFNVFCAQGRPDSPTKLQRSIAILCYVSTSTPRPTSTMVELCLTAISCEQAPLERNICHLPPRHRAH